MFKEECISLNDSQLIDLTVNSVHNMSVLSFRPVMWLPNIRLPNSDLLCGPLFMLLREFAHKTNVRLVYNVNIITINN